MLPGRQGALQHGGTDGDTGCHLIGDEAAGAVGHLVGDLDAPVDGARVEEECSGRPTREQRLLDAPPPGVVGERRKGPALEAFPLHPEGHHHVGVLQRFFEMHVQ